MIRASAHGRLAADPKEIETKTGKAMTAGNIACDVTGDRSDGNREPLWLGVVGFGAQAEALARCAKGEPISVMGRLQRSTWTDRNTGEVREQFQIVADVILTPRSARPGQRSKGRRKTENPDQPLRSELPPADPEPFDDSIPF